ncbi:MAG TPA: hypothetical protein PLD05_07140 [Thermogutta sp.]|nr:hypothetical protein [Thermogutta sp.]
MMNRLMRLVTALMLLVCGWGTRFALGQERQKVVIPFDFESRFDGGRYGQMVGDMIWQKLHREGGFVIPDSMADVRDYCSMNQIKLGAETPLEDVRKIVKRDFDADIGIWGSIERAPGASGEIYDITIKCVDFSSSAEPKVIYEKSARTNSVSEIPHLYVQEMLNALYEREPGRVAAVNPIAEENWQKNPNLILGGDFERAIRGVPVGWEDRAGQDREPLGRLVAWVPEPENPNNHVIRFTFDQGVGDSTGVMYYSLPFQVQEGATYRFQCRWRSDGPAVKVFIKCYAEMPSEYRVQGTQPGPGSPSSSTRGGATGTGSPSARSGRTTAPGYVDWSQMRECYRSQQNLKGPLNTWNVHTEDFTPRHTQYTPTWGRVMLYAYLGAGKVEFDDVVVKMIMPASPGDSKKDPRRSMESSVTIKEMEERERASRSGSSGGK